MAKVLSLTKPDYALIPTSRLLEILNELAAIRVTQTEILARLDRPAQPTLSNTDRALLANLLPLIAQRVGGATFTVPSLMQAVVKANDRELAALLDKVGSSKALGKLLAKAVDQDVAGWRVQHPAGRLWSISKCRDMSTGS